jgi:hypothetical protein
MSATKPKAKTKKAPEAETPPVTPDSTTPKLIKVNVRKRFSDAIQFTAEIECADAVSPSIKLGLAVRWAMKSGANLRGADLRRANLGGANLDGADLSGANIVDGGQRSDGYRFVGWIKDGVLQILASCRDLSISSGREHWAKTRGGTPLGDETMAILDHIEAVARIRKMVE